MNTEHSKTNEPHKFGLSLSDKLNLKNPNKNIAKILQYCIIWVSITHRKTLISIQQQ